MGRHLAERHPQLPVICWSPGLVIPRGRDGFFRNSRQANPIGQALFGVVARDLLRLTEHPQRAAELLERLVLDPAMPLGFSYWSNTLLGPGRHRFERAETSAEAADEAKAERLWQMSEQLVD
jgi:protochlorophyllide reductase